MPGDLVHMSLDIEERIRLNCQIFRSQDFGTPKIKYADREKYFT